MEMPAARRRPLLAAVLALLALTIVEAQSPTTLRGTVRDETGTLLAGVTIALEAGGRTVQTAVSPTGRFAFENVPEGTYRLRVSGEGIAPIVRTVVVSARTRPVQIRVRAARRAAPPPGPFIEEAAAGDTHAKITVYYATDRARDGRQVVAYGGARRPGGQLQLGTAVVRIPRDHQLGVIERPTIWTLWREDPSRHFVIEGIRELESGPFYDQMRSTIDRSGAKQAFVFIHGFNVTFESAVYRTAQIAYDLGFDGVPILYSWPSEGHLLRYADDLNNNDWTVEHLRAFLEEISARSGAKTVHLIAHSMGNRALLHALAGMSARAASGSAPRFNQVALTAPDIDADEFRQLSAAIAPLVTRATLYASSNDLALLASSAYQGYQRAGDTRPSVVVAPGVDTVDVSAVDSDLIGHFYYGDNRSVISDLFYVLQGLPASRRAALRSEGANPGLYWVFRP